MQYFEKIKDNRDFRRTYGRGKTRVAPEFVVYAAKGKSGRVRLGITATKKIGCAVKRNRAKRIITAAFRECAKNLNSVDVVVVARGRILKCKSTKIAEIMKKQFCELGLFCDEKE